MHKLIRVLRVAFKTPPFRIQEEGWGEFDMVLILTPKDKTADITVAHDLNFQSEHYETKHPIVSPRAFSYPTQCEADIYDSSRSLRTRSPPFSLF